MAEALEGDSIPGDSADDDSDVVDVAGVAVSAVLAEPTTPRPSVVVVADSWGSNWGERAAATRMVAGALALSASVSVVSIEDRSQPEFCQPRLRYDGVFPVYSVVSPSTRGPGGPRDNLHRDDVVRASLLRQPGAILPDMAARGILDLASLPSTEALLTTMSLEPDVVVLAGPATLWMSDALPVAGNRPRVVFLPLCGDDPVLSSRAFGSLLGSIDAIGAFSEAELDRISPLLAENDIRRLQHVEVALPVNRLTAASGMAGLMAFGRYVLVISGFADDPASGRCPPHDYLRHIFGHVSIAEVRREGWVVTASERRRFDITWAPTRMNLWRLMAGAEVTLDVRAPGPIGRETIESLHFGTPVVVPDASVPAEHARSSNGGLWYDNPGEMVDCVRTLLDDVPLATHLGESGERWAMRHHGDMDSFVESVVTLVLGQPSAPLTEELGGDPVENV
jgi:hypothetical protein